MMVESNSLSYDNIRDEGCEALAEALKTNNVLTTLR